MQPVKLIIQGDFWDVQLYSGRLYLFDRDGTVTTLNWNKLVEALPGGLDTRLVAECALRRSDYLYANDLELFFRDPDVRQLLTDKFDLLANKPFVFERGDIAPFVVGRQTNPFPFPHADCTIYRNRLWVVGMDGVFGGSCAGRTKYPLSTKTEKSWDAQVFSTSASYGSLALSAGSEGLWEHNINPTLLSARSRDPYQITATECDSCDWMYHSIYGQSYEGGFLAEFEREHDDDPFRKGRQFSGAINDQRIFERAGYSWGTKDKIYMASEGRLDAVRYSPFEETRLTHIGHHSISKWEGNIVSGGVAPFGTIAEYDNALIVLPSAGEPIVLPGEPVRWRVYPRATYYQNHLHVVYEDRIEVLSFNHDYFVDQKTKFFGSKPLFQSQQTYRSN